MEELSININTKGAVKSLDELLERQKQLKDELKNTDEGTKKFDAITKAVSKYDNAIGKSLKTLGGMRSAAALLNDELANVQVGTNQYKKLQTQLVSVNKQIEKQEQGLKTLNPDEKAGELGKLAGGLGSVGTAAALAFGDNKDAEAFFATFAKGLAITNAAKGAIETFTSAQKLLRGVMAASAAVTAVSAAASTADAAAKTAEATATAGATAAQNGLNFAMLANPIGIIVLAIAAVVAGFIYFKDVILDLLKVAFFPYILAFEAIKKGLQSLGLIQSEEAKKMEASEKAKTAKLKELHKQKMKLIKEEIEANKEATIEATDAIDFEIAKRAAAGEDTAELEKQKIQVLIASTAKELELVEARNESKINELKILAKFGGYIAEKANERLKEIEDERKAIAKNLEGYTQDLEVFEIKQTKIASDEIKKRSSDRNKANDDRIKAEQDAQEKLAELREKAYQDRLAAIQKEIDAEANIEKFKFDLMKDGLDKQIEADRLAYRARFDQLNQFLDDKSITEQEYNELQLELSRNQNESEQAIRDEYDAKNAEKDAKIAEEKDKQDEKDLADAKALEDAKYNMASQGINMLSELVSSFAGKSEASQKKAFNFKKGADISMATLDGYRAVMGALAEPAVFPGERFIKAAAAGGFAIAQIAKIARTQFGSSSAPSTSSASSAAPSAPQGASLNQSTLFSTGGDPNSLISSQNNGSGGQSASKVYVLESDITNTQKNVANIKETATL